MLAMPDLSALTPAAIGPALDRALEEQRQVVEDIVARRPKDFADAWLAYEKADQRVDILWSAVSHLHYVADSPQLREAYSAG